MTVWLELPHDCFEGGSIGTDKRLRPNNIVSACGVCNISQPFKISSHGQRNDQSVFSATSKCLKCGSTAKFVLTYPEVPNSANRIDPETIFQFVEASYIGAQSGLKEQERKIHARLKSEDFGGAISASFTFLEQFLKIHLVKLGSTDFSPNEGDLRKLFKSYQRAIKQNSSDDLESALKPLTTALNSTVNGLYEVANKLSDRHVPKAEVGPAEAKLAVMTTLSLCEYLADRHIKPLG
ncbi:MAG: abortive infection family protein [Pseudomonadota bacterium]